MWLSIAADRNFEPSKKLLPTLAEKLTPEQIVETQKLAADWKKVHGE